MKTPFQEVKRFIQRHAMLEGARGVLVAVSGGPDSVVLLDMLVRIVDATVTQHRTALSSAGKMNAKTERQALPQLPVIHVAHLDHMLRGHESTEDAEFVRALAERFGLPVSIRSVDVREVASGSGRNLEDMAREIRYASLRSVAGEMGCDRIAVGHTMTDQAETLLMRLIRGAGLRGLSAMRPVSTVPGGGRTPRLIRPLLCITREEVQDYCTERRLDFRMDSTNLNLNYTRNRVRSEVLPALTRINPRVIESISRAAENIAADEDVLDGLASRTLETVRIQRKGAAFFDDSSPAYSVAALLEQPRGMRRRMIVEAIRLARAESSPERSGPAGAVGSGHVAAMESLLDSNASGKHLVLPGLLEVWREFNALVVKSDAVAKQAWYRVSIEPTSTEVKAGGFAFALRRGLPVEMKNSMVEETLREKELSGQDWMSVALDDQSLPEVLIIRPRLQGERAHVVGQRRTIKLKNIMIDHRIPSSRRATWPLVTTLDGRYIWSPGLPPSLEFAAHVETQRLATLRAIAL